MNAFYLRGYEMPGDFVDLVFVCIVFPPPYMCRLETTL